MKSSCLPGLGLCLLAAWASPSARADDFRAVRIASLDHEQTFAYGTEQRRIWMERGRDRHLVLRLEFTNDPFVSRDEPREYDNFTFAFPQVRLGADGRTYYYHSIPIARKSPDFLGIDEIHLLPAASLEIERPHGFLTVSIFR